MSYIDTTLLANERVVYRCRHHWILFLQPIWMMLVGLLFASWGLSLLSKVVLFISALQWLNQGLIYFTSEFGITTQRVIVKYGFIRRRSFENALSRVESVQVDQSVVGRLLNYGSVVVRGIGGSAEVFHPIPQPLLLRQKVQEQMEIKK
ncbi:PH domain-containing protein [Rickettsiella massiliensis]|uniref:PH domain-containing protein n=1 Tax=Rickettsiella massiliensis TaxID=676517 RepID=UPI00029A155B|nr:PH domain-containing protein [Rickettsiella massiliensis]